MQKIAEKIFKVYQEIKTIGKDMQIETNRGTYAVRSETAVLEAIRPLFIKYGLILVQTEAYGVKTGTITSVNTKYMLIDSESGEYLSLASYGEGSDKQDKGAGMALTYAMKNMLLKTFMIVSGDDADNESSDKKDSDIGYRLKAGFDNTFGILQKKFGDGLIDSETFDAHRQELDEAMVSKDLDTMIALYKHLASIK